MEWLRWILLLLGIVLIGAIYWSGRRAERERGESLFERARRVRDRRGSGTEPGAPAADVDEAQDTGTPEPDLGAVDLEVGAGRPGDPAADALEPEPEPWVHTGADDGHAAPGADAETGADTTAPAEPEAAAPRTDAPAGDATTGPARGGRARARRDERAGRDPSAGEGPGDDERLIVLYVVAPRGERLVGARIAESFARHGLEHGSLDIYHAGDSEGRTVFSVANVVEPGTFDPATMDTLSTPGLALFMRLPGPQAGETAFDRMVRTARALADELGAQVLDGDHSTLTRQTEQHLRDDLRDFDHRRSRSRS